jgi:DNA-binding CsgD family transcriptional regulator
MRAMARHRAGGTNNDWAAPPGIRATCFRVGIDEFALISFDWVKREDDHEAAARLSPSERAVADLAAQGHSNAAIARIRSTSVRTVENQIASVYRKLGLDSRRGLALVRAGARRS